VRQNGAWWRSGAEFQLRAKTERGCASELNVLRAKTERALIFAIFFPTAVFLFFSALLMLTAAAAVLSS
jgi:hypothetical protein